MQKRGQVTLFVIIGIVIFAVIALIFYARSTIFLPTTPENLREELANVQQQVVSCMDDGDNDAASAKDIIITIGMQGGYLNPGADTYRLYNDTRISYLCYNIPNDDRCYNRLLTKNQMEEQISSAIVDSLSRCVDFNILGRFKPYDIISQPPSASVEIGNEAVLVDLNYPIILQSRKSDARVTSQGIRRSYDMPLGKLYDVSQDIIDFETTVGRFDVLTYMLSKQGRIRIYPLKPYPDKIYIIKEENNDYVFQFAVQDEPGF